MLIILIVIVQNCAFDMEVLGLSVSNRHHMEDPCVLWCGVTQNQTQTTL